VLRVCGATQERDALSRSRCWCRGLFCGRGGAKLSTQFRREMGKAATASSAEAFEDLVAQADLFDGDGLAAKWRARLAGHFIARSKPAKRGAAAAAEGVTTNA
jgi:hypothetical protein